MKSIELHQYCSGETGSTCGILNLYCIPHKILINILNAVYLTKCLGNMIHPTCQRAYWMDGVESLCVIDNTTDSLYVTSYRVWRIKKAGHVDPLSLDTDGWNRHCFRYATTEPATTWNIMDVIKPYRRCLMRLSLYFLMASQPAGLLQPVRRRDRGPPISQTHYGYYMRLPGIVKNPTGTANSCWAVIY